MVLKTGIDDLVLRPFRGEDAGFYSRYANNCNIWKFMRDEFPHPYTYNHAVEYINDVCIPNKGYYFAIDYQGTAIGDIHIAKQTDILRLSGFLGYWIAEEFWGKGFVTEAVKTITRHAFDNLGLIRVFARYSPTTQAQFEYWKRRIRTGRIFQNAIIKEGVILDQLQYAKLKP